MASALVACSWSTCLLAEMSELGPRGGFTDWVFRFLLGTEVYVYSRSQKSLGGTVRRSRVLPFRELPSQSLPQDATRSFYRFLSAGNIRSVFMGKSDPTNPSTKPEDDKKQSGTDPVGKI